MPETGTAGIGLALLLWLVALLRPAWRLAATRLAAVLLVVLLARLGWALLQDDFSVRVVWLYSAPQLPWYLKLANLWGGDEGTLLVLTAAAAIAALWLVRRPGWVGPVNLLLALYLGVGLLRWNPFAATSAAELASQPYQGMNAHLTRIWMVFHPPLLFIAYSCVLFPLGAALQALYRMDGPWPAIAGRSVRLAWLTLTAGLGIGMWWAYQDFTFGQVWHWDPVQTGIFVVWALLTAQMHCLRRYRPAGAYRWIHPLLGVLGALAVLLSLAVTRSPELASSHRYVGATSLPWWLFASAVVLVAGGLAVVAGRRAERRVRRHLTWFDLAILLLAGCAVIAAGGLAYAYVAEALGWPRPDQFKPFMQILVRWTSGSELARLNAAFARWDVDPFAVNRWLTPLGALVGLIGGHAFLAWLRRPLRWLTSLTFAAAALAAALWWQPFQDLYRGTGMTSSQTVANFSGLDALAVCVLYLALAALLWSLRLLRQRLRGRRASGYAIAVGLIHVGVVIALVAILVATVFDSYSQRFITFPQDLRKPIALADGYRLEVNLHNAGNTDDGSRGVFRAVASVRWQLRRADRVLAQAAGYTIYRDDRPQLPAGEAGAVRLMCEMLDYRYARTVSDGKQMIEPFIHRGWRRDVQVWFPAVVGGAEGREVRGESLPVIIKVFPLLSWLWVGLALLWGGALWATLQAWRRFMPH